MSLRELVRTGVAIAMETIGDLKETGTYYSSGPKTFDVATDVLVDQYMVIPGVPMVITNFTNNQFDNIIVKETDQLALIEAVKLPVDPQENDRIEVLGRMWNVRRVQGPPTFPIWKLVLREA